MPLTSIMDKTEKGQEIDFKPRADEVTLLVECLLPELLEFVLSCL